MVRVLIERHVPEGSAEHNATQMLRLRAALGIPAGRFLRPDTSLPLDESAGRFDGEVRAFLDRGGRIPAASLPAGAVLVAEGARPGSRGAVVPGEVRDGVVAFTVTPEISGRWIYAVPGGSR